MRLVFFTVDSISYLSALGCHVMSVLDDFARIRLYRTRASEFALLADTEVSPDVRLRYRIIAEHYRELADREEQADKARIAERTKRVRLQRQEAAPSATPQEPSESEFFLIAAE